MRARGAGTHLHRKLHLYLCERVEVRIAFGLAVQAHDQLHLSGLPLLQVVQVEVIFQAARGVAEAFFGVVAAHAIAVVQHARAARRTGVCKVVAIGRAACIALFQRLQHLVGHVPVARRGMLVLQIHGEGDVIARLQFPDVIRPFFLREVVHHLALAIERHLPVGATLQMIGQCRRRQRKQQHSCQGQNEDSRSFHSSVPPRS